ncbi:hypothetical protein [Suipraeoptans intestinalis]|uniref:hypothetical protein n=1 Tax=Suipraeoptans intestinalis TaxID=2606628 RepID=UPI0012B2FA09|nr:hypothetical protein [Suipraeoptans intestinalis]
MSMKIKENPCKHAGKHRESQREGSGASGASPGKKKRLTRKREKYDCINKAIQ